MKRHILLFTAVCLGLCAATACSDDSDSSGKTYNVGDLYDQGGVKGIVYELSDAGGRHGMILSLDETKLAWSTVSVKTGAIDEVDGALNQAKIQMLANWRGDYPAFAWCADKNVGGVSGWYLPAEDQIYALYKVWAADKDKFNGYLTANDGTPIVASSPVNGYYWSSTEEDSETGTTFAVAYMFWQDVLDHPLKSEEHQVRAVRAF